MEARFNHLDATKVTSKAFCTRDTYGRLVNVVHKLEQALNRLEEVAPHLPTGRIRILLKEAMYYKITAREGVFTEVHAAGDEKVDVWQTIQNLQAEIEKLHRQIKNLQLHLFYQPGGPGAEAAKQDFVEQQSKQ